MSLRDYRQEKSWAIYERDSYRIERAKMLRDKEGKGATEIGKIMGVNESTVRGWLNEQRETRLNQAKNTADFLKKQVDEKGMIDVGKNTELELGITRTQLDKALKRLEMEGYPTFENGIPQPTNPGQQTIQKVLCPPGSKLKAFERVIPNIYDAPSFSYDQILDATNFIGGDYHKYIE